MSISKEKELDTFIKNEVIKGTKKVRGKKKAIAEIVDKTLLSLPVKKVYDMNDKIKNFYFIIVKNYSKKPKLRYFLTISLANNSSDLLVQLAKKFAIKNDLKLIQYSIYPKRLRVQLLAMKEIIYIKDYNEIIDLLKKFRKKFRAKLMRFRKLIENE